MKPAAGNPGPIVALAWLGVLACMLAAATTLGYETRTIRGWTVLIRPELVAEGRRAETEKALELIEVQLAQIRRAVPAPAVEHLLKVRLYLSPPYPGFGPRAEYHPDAGWLRANGRDPAMAKAVEFTNLGILDREVRRMPMLVLHELAHAYHDRVLGFDHPGIMAGFERAKASGVYDSVARRDWQGRETRGVRAYAMTNPKEYFAETTEAFFGMNDMYPFERKELEAADPGAVEMLRAAWGAR
jgi:dipeptidyl-peptidase-4